MPSVRWHAFLLLRFDRTLFPVVGIFPELLIVTLGRKNLTSSGIGTAVNVPPLAIGLGEAVAHVQGAGQPAPKGHCDRLEAVS